MGPQAKTIQIPLSFDAGSGDEMIKLFVYKRTRVKINGFFDPGSSSAAGSVYKVAIEKKDKRLIKDAWTFHFASS